MAPYQDPYAGRQICCNCLHYRPHYRPVGSILLATNCGHCVFPRVKIRKPGQSCEHWTAIKKEPVSEN